MAETCSIMIGWIFCLLLVARVLTRFSAQTTSTTTNASAKSCSIPCLHHRRYSYISKCACEGVTIIVMCFAFWSSSSTLHCSLFDALIADLLNPPFLLILALLPPLDWPCCLDWPLDAALLCISALTTVTVSDDPLDSRSPTDYTPLLSLLLAPPWRLLAVALLQLFPLYIYLTAKSSLMVSLSQYSEPRFALLPSSIQMLNS